MNSAELIALALLAVTCFLVGYVVSDFRRWSIEYRVWEQWRDSRPIAVVVEPENDVWSNGRSA